MKAVKIGITRSDGPRRIPTSLVESVVENNPVVLGTDSNLINGNWNVARVGRQGRDEMVRPVFRRTVTFELVDYDDRPYVSFGGGVGGGFGVERVCEVFGMTRSGMEVKKGKVKVKVFGLMLFDVASLNPFGNNRKRASRSINVKYNDGSMSVFEVEETGRKYVVCRGEVGGVGRYLWEKGGRRVGMIFGRGKGDKSKPKSKSNSSSSSYSTSSIPSPPANYPIGLSGESDQSSELDLEDIEDDEWRRRVEGGLSVGDVVDTPRTTR